MTYSTYILSNQTNSTIYIGVTNNLFKRISEHKKKKNKGFTSKYNTSKLVYYEKFKYVNNSILREKQLKNWKRRWKTELIESNNPFWLDLSKAWFKE